MKVFSKSKLFKLSFLTAITSLLIVSSIASIYNNKSALKAILNKGTKLKKPDHEKWAKLVLKGGYILHFRHAQKQSGWKDLIAFDQLELNNFFKKGKKIDSNNPTYYKDTGCLGSKGKIQARAMNDLIKEVNLPIGHVFSSPICRARETAQYVFNGYEKLDEGFTYMDITSAKPADRGDQIRELYQSLPIKKGTNTIVSAHNGVLSHYVFDNLSNSLDTDLLFTEEGSFYVISQIDNKLYLEHNFEKLSNFSKYALSD